MGVFPTKTIDEITETLIDYRGKTPPKFASGVQLITAKVIKEGFIQDGNHEYISEETYESWMRRGLPQQWDILVTTEAPLGQVAQLRTRERVALAQRVILLRGEPSIIDQQYYFQALKSPFVQGQLQARATGTTVLGIKQSELRQVEVPYYPLPTQRKIAAILSAYDDLIENNLRRIKILENMAQLIYREWFVHFRFPGHEKVKMVDSELGMIPEGWRLGKINELVTIKSGYAFKSNSFVEAGHYGLVTIKNVHDGRFVPSCQSQIQELPANMPSYCHLHTGDILLSLTGNIGRACLVYGDDLLLNQRVAKVIPVRAAFRGYAYLFSRQRELQKRLEALASGVAQQNLSPALTAQMEVLLPPNDLITSFAGYSQPIVEEILVLYRQTSNLRHTRDLLLPRLILGELDVSELDINTGEEPA